MPYTMTTQEINYYKAATSLGLIPDEENPLMMLNGIPSCLLIEIANGRLDAMQLAKIQLRERGLDEQTGRFVGWNSIRLEDVFEQ
jgi:hypothetical protein